MEPTLKTLPAGLDELRLSSLQKLGSNPTNPAYWALTLKFLNTRFSPAVGGRWTELRPFLEELERISVQDIAHKTNLRIVVNFELSRFSGQFGSVSGDFTRRLFVAGFQLGAEELASHPVNADGWFEFMGELSDYAGPRTPGLWASFGRPLSQLEFAISRLQSAGRPDLGVYVATTLRAFAETFTDSPAAARFANRMESSRIRFAQIEWYLGEADQHLQSAYSLLQDGDPQAGIARFQSAGWSYYRAGFSEGALYSFQHAEQVFLSLIDLGGAQMLGTYSRLQKHIHLARRQMISSDLPLSVALNFLGPDYVPSSDLLLDPVQHLIVRSNLIDDAQRRDARN